MRIIHIVVPRERAEIMQTILNKLGVRFSVISDEKNSLFLVTERDENVEIVIDEIKKLGVGDLYGSFQVYAPEYASGEVEIKVKRIPSKRASREEILADVQELARLDRNYILYSILAAMLATLGLLTNNLVIIIASMIIAPFIGPILGTSLGIVLNIDQLRKESMLSEFIGIGLSILTGFLFSMIMPHTVPTTQIMLRAHPTYVDVLFAVVAGFAVAISVVSVTSMALVGVAIAASILPPAANIGIGLTFLIKGSPYAYDIIFGSTLLLVINILAITTMSIVFFWFEGLTPGESIRKKLIARKVVKRRLIAVTFALIVALVPIIHSAVIHYKEEEFESKVRSSVISYISDNYPDVEIINLEVSYIESKNVTYIYLTIGVNNVSQSLNNIASDIAEYIENEYHVKAKVYVSISLTNSSFDIVNCDVVVITNKDIKGAKCF